jgi:hypothetical protein
LIPAKAVATAPGSETDRTFFQEGLARKPAEAKPDAMEEAAQTGPVLKLFDVAGMPSLEARVDGDRPVLMLQTRAGASRAITAGEPR